MEKTKGTVVLPFSFIRIDGNVSPFFTRGFMRHTQSLVALLCASMLVLPPANAQQAPPPTDQQRASGGLFFNNFTQKYKVPYVPPVSYSNSSRLDALMRSGRIYLTLQDTIALALENNLDIESARFTPLIAKTGILRAEAGGLLRGVSQNIVSGPNSAVSQVTGGNGGNQSAGSVTGGGSGGTGGGTIITSTGVAIPQFDDFLYLSYGVGHRTSPQSNSFSSGITSVISQTQSYALQYQKAFVTGTTVQAGFNNLGINSNVPRLEINPYSSANASVQVTQRLLQGFGSGYGTTLNTRNIRIAKKNVEIADLTFKNQVIATVSSVVNLYSDLVSFYEDVKVKRQALSYAEKLYNDNRKQVEIGTLAPIEIVRAEAEVASRQQDLTTSETVLLQQETIIKNALSRTGVQSPELATARVVPVDALKLPDVEQIQPIQDLVAMALAKRPEIAQTDLNIETTKLNLLGSKSQLLPSLDLVGSLQNNALAGDIPPVRLIPNPNNPSQLIPSIAGSNPAFVGGFGSVLGQIFRRNYPDYNVSLNLTIPLRNRSALADVINDQLSLRQQEISRQKQINQVRVDVQNAVIGVQQARARYNASVKSRVLQEQTLDAEQKKYALGASTIFFVIQAQRDLATAQGQEVSALSSYNRARTNLAVSTGQILDEYGIVMDEAVKGKVNRPPAALPATDRQP